MSNDFRDLDAIVGLTPVADVAPPLLGGGAPPRGGRGASRVPRPAAARRPTVQRPGPVRPPASASRAATSSRPLASAVGASTGRMGAEPLTAVVSMIAWLTLLAAAANACFLLTRGGLTTALPFSGYVGYGSVVNDVVTWRGHQAWPAAASAAGAAALAVAAFGTRGLRQASGASGALLFGGLCAALLGIAGTVVGLAIVALATGIGVAIVIAIGVLVLAAGLMLIGALLSG